MPDKKYLIEIPGMPEGSGVWDSDKWERNKDAFMSDYPEANVFELGEYDAEDTNENDQIMLTFENDPDSSGVWDSAKWERNKEAFTADHPEAKVNRVRYVDYWSDRASAIENRLAELEKPDEERAARLAEIGYFDDKENAVNLDGNLKPVSQAMKVNSVSGDVEYLDPAVEEFFANDDTYTKRQLEKNQLKAEYDANPSVIAQREWEAQRKEAEKAYRNELKQQITADYEANVDKNKAARGGIEIDGVPIYGPASFETEKQEKYLAALQLLDFAERMENGEKFWEGVGYGTTKAAVDYDGKEMIQVGLAFKKLEDRGVNILEATEEEIDEALDPEDKALMRAYLEYEKAMYEAEPSNAFKGGAQFGETIPFILEFIATGNIYKAGAKKGMELAGKKAIGKGFAKWIAKSAGKKIPTLMKRGVAKASTGTIKALSGTLTRTLASPTTYTKMATPEIQISEQGDVSVETHAAREFFDHYIENLSEISGEGMVAGLGGAAKLLKSTKIGKMPFMKLGEWFGNKAVWQGLSKLGAQSLPIEVAEEIVGNALRYITGVDKEALGRMFEKDEFASMLIGFAPLTVLGMGTSAASMGAVNIGAARAAKRMRETLNPYYTEEQIDNVIGSIEGAKTSDEVVEALRPIMVGMYNATPEEKTAVMDYGISVAKKKAMISARNFQEMQLSDASVRQIEDNIGKFWIENEDKTRTVRQVNLNDGRQVYIVSQPNEVGEVATVEVDTGKKGMAKLKDIKEEIFNSSLESYGTRFVMADRKAKEQERMANERQEQINLVRQNLAAQKGKINLGTEGSPIMVIADAENEAGVRYVAENGSTGNLSWDAVADAMGTPIRVFTDSQIVEQEIADIVARDAERKAQRAQQKGDNAVAASEAVAEASETVDAVAQETKHIPLNEDGTVNEAAFWEQDPEGYAQWNDEQNQDGGADTIQQIEAAKAELTAMLNEAQQATLTSNPANRKAAKREAGRLAERLARLEALEQSYADRALAPLRERAKMWADLTGAPVHVIETEEELAAISATVASENAKPGSRVRGFAKDGKAYIFLPGIQDVREIDEVFFHEAVAHNGLKGLLGKENYDKLCEQVWNMMSPAARNQFIRYPGVNGDYRAAADEYIAHIAEKMGAGIAEAEEKTIWQKIVDFVRNVLRAMGIELNVTEQELSDLLHQAYADLANNMAKAEQTASREAMSAVEEAPSEARQQYDALLEDLTPEEIEAVAQNDFNAAQEAYNAHLANAPKVEPGESSKAYIERKKAYNDELKRLESELNAQQALMDEITAIKAANAPVLTDVEILEQDGFGVDTQNDDVRMSVRYTPTDEQKEAIINSIVNVTGRSREEAERWLASETSLAAMINDDLQYLDYVADPKYKAIKDNSDYPQGTVDFNNICRKRVPFTRMFTRLQRAFPNRVFTADELADIRTIMSKDGLTVACGLCYVEDRRQMVGEVAQSFIDGIQEGFETYANNPTKRKNAEKFKALIGEDAYVPQVYDLTTQEGLDKLYNEHRGIWEAFQAFNNARGQQSQNLLQGYAEYKREILSWSDKKVKQVNDNGGLRIFSYSDFEAHHLIDVVQIIIDCASKGVKIQGYTKVPAFARAVANTGIKLNRSLIPLGDTGLVDGQLAFDPVEGIDINDPDFLESNDNVGNILIGINDEQIRVAMNDPRIHYIIPYHARQKENIRQKLNVGAWTNYISTQNERNVSDGKRVKDNINIYTDILTEDITTDRQFVEKYLQLCAEQGRIPKFDQFLDKDAEGNYVYTPGYYKFLIDFKLFDENGNILPQQPVVAEFDDAFNMQILENYAKDERESTGEQMNETYDKIVDALGLDGSAAEGEDVRFSSKLTDREIDNLVDAMKANAEVAEVIALTPENWEAQFGAEGIIESPVGEVKMGPNQVTKLFSRNREEYFGMIKPTLTRPDVVVEKFAPAEDAERDTKYVFIKSFVKPDGSRIIHFESVTVQKEGREVSVSSHEAKEKDIKKEMQNGKLLHLNSMLSLSSEGSLTEAPIQERPDLVPTSNNVTSDSKDSENLEIPSDSARFSVITPQMDADYLAAVERGDMETAQRMVVEAAKLAMPNTKVVDEEGNPLVVYHGTNADFNEFDTQYASSNTGAKNGTLGFYFTPLRSYAEKITGDSSVVKRVFLNIQNPLDLGYAKKFDGDYHNGREAKPFNYEDSRNIVDGLEAIRRAVTKKFGSYTRENVSKWKGLVESYYDGMRIMTGDTEDFMSTLIPSMQYIAFHPSQIKSADPVTYDDAGNVIPLSKRFNPANEDIRFSVRTDEQREKLFADAKAEFGLTDNFNVAGYMLPDGSLLNFGDPANPTTRAEDHRAIEGVIMENGTEYDSRWMYLADFMNEGAIRLLPEYAGINLMKAPTKEQRQKLFDFIYKYNGEVILEIADERLNNVAYVEYDRRTSPSRIFRDIDGYFNEGIVPEQDVRFSVRTVNQTAQEFHNDALTDFRRQFNLIQPTTVVDVNDRAALAEALGLTPEELSDEKYQLILDAVNDGGRSFYDDDTKRIAIFALEKQRTSAEVDENIFHENTHAIVSKNPEVLELGQWLWDNAKSGIRMKTRNSILDSNYPEWQYANEMLSRYTGIILSMGRAGEVLNMLPEDQKKHWEFILKEFGYEPEREDGERIRRYDADSRRAGFFRKMSQQKMSDNGAAEKGTRFSSVGITPEVRDEMDRIAATAIIDGNYMLAPNGQPTKLTADQWALVRTGNFKRWFGDWENDPDNASKVVDENGEPMVVYHGTNLSVTNKGVPFWTFYEDQHFGTEEQAKELARAGRPEAERKMYEVFLNIRNIKRVPDVPQDWIKNHSEYWEPVFAQAKTEGYDGLVYVNEWEDSDSKSDSYVAFAPSQIKSATDNTGEFSAEEGDIRLSFKPVGGNSGYVGYSMSRRAAMARSEGRYPKTDFRKEYGVTSASLDALVYFDIIDNSEWHHTSVYGNKTTFYGWSEEEYADIYADNKKVIDGIAREFKKADEAYRNSGKELHERLVAGEITPQEVYELGREADRNHLRSIDEMRAKIDSIFNPSEEGDIRYSLVTDPALLERLESEPTIKVYRAMQLIDGKLYPPMSAKVDGKMREPIELGKWEQAEERPDLADEKGYFKLDKGNKTSLKARYNPYFHTSPTPLNDQFSSAQTRPELVTVEVEVPESELTSGYKAEKAKDSVGKMEWKAGVIQGKLSGTRTVILSRWDKPVRIVPDSEVADVIVKMFEGKDITMPSNVVTPSLRAELEKKGVPFVETDNSGKPMKEDVRFSVVATPTEIEAVKGLSILDAMNISLDHEMTMVKDMIDAERALIKNLQKKNQNPLIEQQIQNAEKRLAANLRQMEILQEVEDQLIDTKHVEPDYQSALSDMEPQTRFEYLSQMFTMRLSPITQTKVTAEDGTETTVRQGGKKKGLMLTPQTLVKDLGWSKSDWKGISYIVSESEGTTIDAIAEMIEQDSEAGYLFAGMDTMQIKDEIIDFLWSMDTYASIRDYIKNERTRKAEEEAEHANEIIDKFIERLESEYGMSADAYNAMIVQQSRAARESWLASVENPNEFAKFEESKDEENGRYTDNQGENRQSISTDGGTEDAAASGEGDSTGEAVQERVPGDSAGNAGSSGPSGNIGRDDSGSKGEGRRDGVVPDDVETSRKSVDEIVENGKQKVVEANAAAADAFMLRLRKINGNLMQLRRAASAQREYDKNTVQIITSLANELLENGALSDMTRGEIKRLLSVIKDSVGKSDLTISVDRLMDIMIGNQLRFGRNRFYDYVKIRDKKVDARGVEVRGKLDVEGQMIMNALREGIGLDAEKLQERISEAEDRLFDTSETIRRNAENDLVGYQIALEYLNEIKASETEEKDLRKELKTAKEEYGADRMTKETYREFVKSTNDAIRENRMQRVMAYEGLLEKMADMIQKSIRNAGQLREAEKQRIEQIQHYANSDMQGMPADEHKAKDSAFWNNPIVRFLFKPLATFDQMLRHFAPKSRSGEGYLWNHFMGGWLKATENEYKGIQSAHEKLDAKAKSVFGNKVKRWSDLFALERKMPKAEISFWDAGEIKSFEVTQGNLLYIYMVNKMTDGKMKLRRMGISEEDVINMTRELDPRFVELADWLQEDFLPGLREKYNAVHEKLFGAPMAAIDNYFPIRVLANARSREVDINIEESNAKPSTITGNIIKRTKNSLALDILGSNAFDVVLGHINDMERWAAFAEWNKDLNTLLSYKKFRNRVQNMSGIYGAGSVVWNNFRSVAEIAAGVYKPATKADSVDKTIMNIAKGVTGAKISFRVYTAFKQLLSWPAFISDANPVILAKNMANPFKAWNWSMENLPLFEKRWKSRQAGDSRLMKTDADWKLWKSKVVEIAGRLGMTPNALVDAVTVAIGARSVYETRLKQYLDYGYDQEKAEEKAKRDATVTFNESQQSNESAFLSQIQMDRTVASVVLTVFRNSSMGYQRMYVDALRNITHMTKRGYKAESIEYMKKQMMRDGLTEAQAERAANRIYSRSFAKNAVQALTFGFIVQLAWNLGPYLPYIFIGDDDEEKKEMAKDAAVRALVGGPVEGMSGGPVLSNISGNIALGEKLSEVNGVQLPLASDMENLFKLFGKDNVRAINEIFNIIVQSGIGVNPQTITDAAVAIVDACNGDLETASEAAICLMRILQVPQSQIEEIYLDEIDFTAEEALDLTIREFAERYARYKVLRSAPLTNWMYDDEQEKEREESYIKRFTSRAEELKRTRGSEAAKTFYEYYDNEYAEMNESLRELKRRAKEAEGAESKAISQEADSLVRTESFQRYSDLIPDIKAYEAYKKLLKDVTDPATREEYEKAMLRHRDNVVNKINGYE